MAPLVELLALLHGCDRSDVATHPLPGSTGETGTRVDTGTTTVESPTGDTADSEELGPCDTGFPVVPVGPQPPGATRWWSWPESELLGREVAVADVDGDGAAEVLAAAPAQNPYGYRAPFPTNPGVYLLEGAPAGGPIDLAATAHYLGLGQWSYIGNHFGYGEGIAMLPDTTGDGSAEVVILGGSGTPEKAFAFEAALAGPIDLPDAVTVFTVEYGSAGAETFDEALGAGDVTGDGVADLVLRGSHGFEADQGALYLFSGTPTGVVPVDSAPVIVIGGAPGERTGVSLASVDLDGDGQHELLTGAIDNAGPGHVTVIDHPPPGITLTSEYPVRIHGEPGGYDAGITVAGGDLDGDGHGDLATGDHIIDCRAGRAYLELGPFEGERQLADADVVVHAVGRDDFLGWSTTVGDYDGDGQLDWAIGSPRDPYAFAPPGRVAVYLGPVPPGRIDETAADAVWSGQKAMDQFGYALASGDVDGDGRDDLVVGAPGDSTWALWAGSVTLIPGAGL